MPWELRRLAIVAGLALAAITSSAGSVVDGRRWEAARPIESPTDARISSVPPSGRRWA
jgi:hypothetical protein